MGPHRSTLCLAWRLSPTLYEADDSFEGLRRFLEEHRDVVDEATLFETVTHHLYLPLELLERRARVIKDRLASLRRMGLRAGINVGTTLGHMDEAWDYMPPCPSRRPWATTGPWRKAAPAPTRPTTAGTSCTSIA